MNKFMKNTTENNYGRITIYLEYEDIINNIIITPLPTKQEEGKFIRAKGYDPFNDSDWNLGIVYNIKTKITANNIMAILYQAIVFCYQKDIEEAKILQDINCEEHNVLATVYKKDAWSYCVDMYGWGRQVINIYDLLKDEED